MSTTVSFDQGASAGATVVECSGPDRPGLLEALARALADAGVSLQSAHVETVGARAVDSFYVTDAATGAKLEDGARLHALADALRAALQPHAPAGPRRLARARASAGR
ncbi:MAG: ACT domain-containing protein [Caulobacteraceae bacterium]|nr:ACT domain-containing protein [Caulobacter sp.]